MTKTEAFQIKCPNCKMTINIPYFKDIEAMTPEQIDMEIAEAWAELAKYGYISWDDMLDRTEEEENPIQREMGMTDSEIEAMEA